MGSVTPLLDLCYLMHIVSPVCRMYEYVGRSVPQPSDAFKLRIFTSNWQIYFDIGVWAFDVALISSKNDFENS